MSMPSSSLEFVSASLAVLHSLVNSGTVEIANEQFGRFVFRSRANSDKDLMNSLPLKFRQSS